MGDSRMSGAYDGYVGRYALALCQCPKCNQFRVDLIDPAYPPGSRPARQDVNVDYRIPPEKAVNKKFARRIFRMECGACTLRDAAPILRKIYGGFIGP